MGEIYDTVTTGGGWSPALTATGEVNEHADVADITILLPTSPSVVG
ncbi:hypothetical protein [Miniimonas sp. S16]|nr:hypothetical protein [Miniimonas sp. S16]